jgi:selenide,water dikinase
VQVLKDLPLVQHPNLLVGTETGDDAGVYKLQDNLALVFTMDFFPPVVDDPFDFGAIAAANSLSDVYAMGGKPLLALNIVGFPNSLPKEILGTILQGGYAKAQEASCLIVGGHTVDDEEPKYGMAVVGTVTPGQQVTNAGAKPGDQLVLTKPLGTGVITTAAKQGVVSDEVLQGAVDTMARLNQRASEAMMQVGPHACTDVTGFGLMGHLEGMVRGSEVAARIHLGKIPVLPGVQELLAQGVAPAGTHRNLEGVEAITEWHPDILLEDKLLICDAQTSGGLLISVAGDKVQRLLKALEERGIEDARVVGEIIDSPQPRIGVSP